MKNKTILLTSFALFIGGVRLLSAEDKTVEKQIEKDLEEIAKLTTDTFIKDITSLTQRSEQNLKRAYDDCLKFARSEDEPKVDSKKNEVFYDKALKENCVKNWRSSYKKLLDGIYEARKRFLIQIHSKQLENLEIQHQKELKLTETKSL